MGDQSVGHLCQAGILHYAVHGSTAAEIIVARADHTKEHMGLTSWRNAPDGKIVKAFAESEFEQYRVIQDRLYQSDFDRLLASAEESN